MKKLFVFALFALFLTASAYATQPDKALELAINNYLEVLKSTNTAARLEALTKLNEFKNQYPNYKMKEFDNFMSGKIMEKSTQNLLSNLASPNAGVRHSTLHVLVRLKSDYPNLDMSVFYNAVTKMSNSDPIPHLQVDAKIALLYLKEKELATKIKVAEGDAPGDTFTQIHLAMDKAFGSQNQ